MGAYCLDNKNRESLLIKTVRPAIFKHMYQNALKKEILIDIIGGYVDHVTAFFDLKMIKLSAK